MAEENEHYVMKVWPHPDSPTQYVIHRFDGCVPVWNGVPLDGAIVSHLREEPGVIWLCHRCLCNCAAERGDDHG